MTEEERKEKEEQESMYKTMGQYNGPTSNPRDRVIWDSSDEDEVLDCMYRHVPDPEQKRHLNTIQKNFSVSFVVWLSSVCCVVLAAFVVCLVCIGELQCDSG